MTTDASATLGAQPLVERRDAFVPLRLFGAVELALPGRDRTVFTGERRFQLLAYLACRQAWVSRDELANFLWPDRTQAAARSNLRKTLLLAQRVPGVDGVETQGDRVRWQADCDLARFEADVRAERHAAALQWRRGPLLEGLESGLDASAAEWIAFERQRVDALWHRCAVQRLTALREQPLAAETVATAMLALDPLDEAATLALARAAAARGRTAQGLAAIDAHVRRLDETMGLPPSAALLTLARELRGGGSGRPGPPAPTVAPAGRVIGRRLELALLRKLLENHRFVTITGPGGVGKSSLAQAAIEGGLREAGDGRVGERHWIAVGDLADTRHVGVRLATAMGFALRASADPWPALAAHIGSKACFVVLDNAESAAGLGLAWSALQQACPGLRALATSRSRVRALDEALLPLDGLPLPDADETDADVLRHNDAVALFAARAAAVQPSFDLGRQAQGVVDLLHAVEGLPLAIELAAAWTRVLPVPEILAEIRRSLDFLESQAGDADPAAGRGLRASFARSWQLVSPAERRALAALSFLPGPFGREMASRAADAPLVMLAALIDKSLLRADGLGRYALHPLIRQFAQQRAGDAGVDEAAVADRHAAYFARWLTAFGSLREKPSQTALDAIEAELVHLRAAWNHAIGSGDAGFVAATATSTTFFFEHRGSWAEGIDTLARAAARFDDGGERPRAEAAARALQGLAHLHDRSAKAHEAEAAARRSLRLASQSKDLATRLDALNVIGTSLWRQGRLAEARPFLSQSLERSRRHGTPYQRMRACTNLSLVEKRLGALDSAVALLEEALVLARELGHWEGMLHQLNGLATTHFLRCDWPAARAALEAALALCDEHRAEQYRPVIVGSLGRVLLEIGLLADAARTLEGAVSQARRFDRTVLEAEALLTLAEARALMGDPVRARGLVRGALHNPAVATTATLQMTGLIAFGEILRAEGQASRTRDLWAWLAAEPFFDEADRAITRRRLAALVSNEPAVAAAAPAVPDDGTPAGVLAMLRRELVTSEVDFGPP